MKESINMGQRHFDCRSTVFRCGSNAIQTYEVKRASQRVKPRIGARVDVIIDVTMTSVGRTRARVGHGMWIQVGCGVGRTVRVKTRGPYRQSECQTTSFRALIKPSPIVFFFAFLLSLGLCPNFYRERRELLSLQKPHR